MTDDPKWFWVCQGCGWQALEDWPAIEAHADGCKAFADYQRAASTPLE
jgi:hypothetical protein